MPPRLSVILPVHNAGPYLSACLQSLSAQSFQDFEIIALDHDSHDASPGMLREAALREPRLRLLESPAAASLPQVLNQGLAAAQGAFIARMDADDISLPGRFDAQMALLQARPEIGLCGTLVRSFGEGKLSQGTRDYAAWVNSLSAPQAILRELFIECPLPHPTWLGRRQVFDSLGYLDDGLPEDYHFVLRAAEAGIGMAKPEGVLLEWRDHGARHSRSHPRYNRPAFMRLRARFLKRMLIKEGECLLWGAGDRGRLLARMLLEEGARISRVVAWTPEGPKPTSVHGIPVIQPEELPESLEMPLIACVGAPGAREAIRSWCGERGWIEGENFWFAS